jgi:hypothetical protein
MVESAAGGAADGADVADAADAAEEGGLASAGRVERRMGSQQRVREGSRCMRVTSRLESTGLHGLVNLGID